MEDVMSVQMCDEENLQCKNCKWAQIVGYLKGSCSKYKQKPASVYYENQPCPKFQQYQDGVK